MRSAPLNSDHLEVTMMQECFGRDCQYWDFGFDCCGLDPEDVEAYEQVCPIEQVDEDE